MEESFKVHDKDYDGSIPGRDIQYYIMRDNLKTTQSLNKTGEDWDNLYKPGHLHGDWLDSQTEVKDAVDKISANNKIDILVNSAGITGPTAELWNYDNKAWDDIININLFFYFNIIKIFQCTFTFLYL